MDNLYILVILLVKIESIISSSKRGSNVQNQLEVKINSKGLTFCITLSVKYN